MRAGDRPTSSDGESLTSALFEPIHLRGLTLENRIVVSEMCQYSAVDGDASGWHLIPLGHLALGGAGLLVGALRPALGMARGRRARRHRIRYSPVAPS